MSEKNQRLVAHEPVEFETSREPPIILEESVEDYTSNERKQTERRQNVNRLDLESLGSWPTMPKHFPGTVSRCYIIEYHDMEGSLYPSPTKHWVPSEINTIIEYVLV